MMILRNFRNLAVVATIAVSGLIGASASEASTLNLLGLISGPGAPPKPYDDAYIRASVTCDACVGINSSATSNLTGLYPLDTTLTGFAGGSYSDLFVVSPSDATELAFVNLVAGFGGGGPFAVGSGAKTDGGGASSKSFTSSAEYIIFKIGIDPNLTVIRNTSGISQLYLFSQIGTGAGLSHYSEFGSVCVPGSEGCGPGVGVVPLPAGLPLLLSAFGIGGLLTRKFRKQA